MASDRMMRDEAEAERDRGLPGALPAGVVGGTRRSPRWREVRERFVAGHPECAVCGGREDLDVHHVLPFHLFPSSELDERNLLCCCRSGPAGVNCHLLMHGGSWRDYVPDAAKQAARLRKMIESRVRG